MAEQGNGVSWPQESDSVERLTCIHQRIHCGATNDTSQSDNESELDSIAIDNFLNTLAEVALAIIRRRQQLD